MHVRKLIQTIIDGKSIFNHIKPAGKIEEVSKIAAETETCGLKLKPLEQDVVEIAPKVEKVSQTVTKPVIETAPVVFKGPVVSMHHDLSGRNNYYREAYEQITGITPIKDSLESIKNILNSMKKVDKEFAELIPLEKECIVWRGRSEHDRIERWNRDFKIIDDAKVGDIIVPDTGYSYTGFKRELAEHWADFIGKRSMMYKIILPKGAKVSRNSEHGGEVVMPRNAQYRLVSKTTYGKRTEVVMEYMLPEKDNVAEMEELIKKVDSML